MVETIGPLVQRSLGHWLASTSLYLASALVAATFLGAMLGWIGELTIRPALPRLVLTLVVATGALIDTSVLKTRLPHAMRRVPQRWWVQWGWPLASVAYGATLGLGVMTAVPYASFYAVLVGAVMLASPLQGAMVVGAYGLGRVVPVLAGSVVFALHGRVDVFLGRMLSGRARVKFIVGLASAAASGLMTAALVAH